MRLFASVTPALSILALVTSSVGCGTPGIDTDFGTDTDTETETADDTTEGETDTETDEDPPQCWTNTDCNGDEVCVEGWCQSDDQDEEECYVDDDCLDGLVCLDFECVASLPTLDHCPGPALSLTTTDVTMVEFPFALALGDIDGQLGDEIVVYQQGSVLSVANGNQLTSTAHPIPYGGVRDAVVLRADADAHPDLWVADGDGFRKFLGDGAGGFSYVGGQYFPDFQLYRLAKAAAPDIDALVDRSGQPHQDHHVFVDPLAQAPSQTMPSDFDPQTGDVDGDGIDELMFVYFDTVEIWSRVADSYVLATTIDCAVEGFSGAGITVGDLDSDGLDDVVCMLAPDNSPGIVVTLWSSLGGLEFAAQPTVFADGWDLEQSGRPWAVIADLDADDDSELVFGTGSFVRLGDDGNFGCHGPLGVSGGFEVGDLDGDGRDELVEIDGTDTLRTHSFE